MCSLYTELPLLVGVFALRATEPDHSTGQALADVHARLYNARILKPPEYICICIYGLHSDIYIYIQKTITNKKAAMKQMSSVVLLIL